MLRCLAMIAVLALSACDDIRDLPTGVSREQFDANPRSLPPYGCAAYIVDDDSVPQCSDTFWLDSRVRHEFESLTVGERGQAGRPGARPF